MKKIIAIVIIVVAIIVSPFITGKIVQQTFEHKIALINTRLEPLTHQKETIKLEYTAGWFSSSAKTTINKVVINHHITHGPYCTFGIAKVDSKFELPAYQKEKVTQFFDGKDPYTITTELGFTGTTHFTITSPSIGQKVLPNSPNTTIVWEGLNYSAAISKNKVDSSFNLPKLSIIEKNIAQFSIENIQSQGTANRLLDKDLNLNIPEKLDIKAAGTIGKVIFKNTQGRDDINLEINNITSQVASTKDNTYDSHLMVDNIKVMANNSVFSTGKINLNSSAKDPFWILRNNLVTADWGTVSTASINDISLDVPQPPIKALLNFNYKQQLTDNKDLIGFSELYNLTDINLQIPNYTNLANTAEFSYSIDGIPKKELAAIVKGYIDLIKISFKQALNINTNRNDVFSSYLALRKTGEAFSIATLQGTPSLTVNAKTTGNKGNANLNLTAALVKPDNQTTNPQMLMMQAQGRLNTKLTINIADSLIDASASMANLPVDQLTEFKQNLVNRLNFVNNQGEYSINIEFKDSMFYVNGQPDPEFLQKYMQFFR